MKIIHFIPNNVQRKKKWQTLFPAASRHLFIQCCCFGCQIDRRKADTEYTIDATLETAKIQRNISNTFAFVPRRGATHCTSSWKINLFLDCTGGKKFAFHRHKIWCCPQKQEILRNFTSDGEIFYRKKQLWLLLELTAHMQDTVCLSLPSSRLQELNLCLMSIYGQTINKMCLHKTSTLWSLVWWLGEWA